MILTKPQFDDFGVDTLFTAYGDGTVTKTNLTWDGYLRETPIDLKDWPAARTLLDIAEGNLSGVAWGYRFAAVLAGTTYRQVQP